VSGSSRACVDGRIDAARAVLGELYDGRRIDARRSSRWSRASSVNTRDGSPQIRVSNAPARVTACIPEFT
jgi:hypothetical protein